MKLKQRLKSFLTIDPISNIMGFQMERTMPNCIQCGHEYNPKRADLGYRTCLDCGSPPEKFIVVPVAKSNYVVGTMSELRESYSHKGNKML